MKKRTIVISVCLGVVAVIVILLFTLFGLHSVSLDLRTYNSRFENSQSEVIDSGKFKYNTPVFFQDKQTYTKNLEKNNPYLKVIGIQTKFPGNMIVKCTDREELFAIKVSEQKYFIVDEDLKLLKMAPVYESVSENAILLDGEFSVLNTNAEIGDFITLSAGQADITKICSALKQNNRNVSEQKALFKEIIVSFVTSPNTSKSELALTFKDFRGLEMSVLEASDDLVLKLNCMLASQSEINQNDVELYTLRIIKNQKGEIFCHQTIKN